VGQVEEWHWACVADFTGVIITYWLKDKEKRDVHPGNLYLFNLYLF